MTYVRRDPPRNLTTEAAMYKNEVHAVPLDKEIFRRSTPNPLVQLRELRQLSSVFIGTVACWQYFLLYSACSRGDLKAGKIIIVNTCSNQCKRHLFNNSTHDIAHDLARFVGCSWRRLQSCLRLVFAVARDIYVRNYVSWLRATN